MDIKNLILIIIACFNLIMSFILLMKNKHSIVNISFFLFFIGASLWSFGIAMFRTTLDMEVAVAWARIYYFAPAIIALAFLLFANHYIYRYSELNEIKIFYFLLPFLFIIFIIFHPTFFIEHATHYIWGNDANEKLGGHFLFALYFFSYLFLAYKILFKKYKIVQGINRRNLALIIYSTMLSYLFGVIFDLVLPLIGNYRHIWVGPYFTLITLIFLTYLIFFQNKRLVEK